MGVVYAAYDPELDRRIALKVLHERKEDGEHRRRRLQREAQAMAKLSHPNVISVYDVGTVEGRVFLAMELVEGTTLGGWRKAKERHWTEVLEVYGAAGRGLHAAHLAGLVHRDFKPDNVLVGVDGRVRVTDFGIARPARGLDSVGPLSESPDIEASISASGSGRMLDLTLTRPGALAGTPAYMSPEQFDGGMPDARADQFSFCVALWGALYGEAPFEGRSAAELATAVCGGRIRELPAGVIVPAFLHETLRRGLSVEPEDRYPDMGVLLDRLDHRPGRRWWWVGGGALLSLSLAGAGWAATRPQPDPCAAVGAPMDEVWNDGVRRELESALVGTGVSYAADTWSRIGPRLDVYATAWREARVDACRATVDTPTPGDLLERRVRCLERGRSRFAALLEVFGRGEPTAVSEVSDAVADLPSVQNCEDSRVLLELPAEPDDAEEQRVQARYDHLRALLGAGDHREAFDALPSFIQEAEAIGRTDLWIGGLELWGVASTRVEPREAEGRLRKAYFEAVRHHRDLDAAQLATTLVFACGYLESDLEAALEWAEHASAAVERAGNAPSRRVVLLRNVGDAFARAGKPQQARERLEWALAAHGELNDDSEGRSVDLIHVRTSLAAVLLDLDEGERARSQLHEALALAEELLGPRHPDVARIHDELGNVAFIARRLDDAEREYGLALGTWEAGGGSHPAVANTLSNIGNVYDLQGRTELARSSYERSLRLTEELLGPEHPQVSVVLVNLGMMFEKLGEFDELARVHARALKIREDAFGLEHASVVNPLLGLARAAIETGDVPKARTYAERLMALRGDADGEAGAQARVVMGRVLVGEGRVEEAKVHFRWVIDTCTAAVCRDLLMVRAHVEFAELTEGEPRAQSIARARAFLPEGVSAKSLLRARLERLEQRAPG